MRTITQFSLSLLFLLLFSLNSFAQYFNFNILEVGTDQDFEFIEDINNDGLIDAVLNGSLECGGGEYFRIYHGRIDASTGNYTFDLVHSNFLNQGFFFYVMDMNGDGYKEAVSQATGNGTITIARYENGKYEDYVLEDTDIDLTFMLDIDNDGIDENIRRVSDQFYRGNFDEDFNYTETIFLTKETNSLSLFDYDKDGIQDFLYFDNDSLHILLIDGELKEEILIYDNELPFVFGDEKLFFDVDQNGDLDYLYRPSNSGGLSELYIAWNIEANGFTQIEVIAQTIALDSDETFHYIDLDFDGREDMVIKDFAAPGDYTYKNAKSGEVVQIDYLDEFDSFDHFSTQGMSQIVVASDYSNDVREPLAVIQYTLESGEYIGKDIPLIIPGYTSIKDALKTDLNKDGKVDLLYSANSSTEFGEKITVRWISDIDGLGMKNSNPILGHLDEIDKVIFMDADADGDADIVSAKDLTIFYNNGFGDFSESKVIENGVDNRSNLKSADTNNDGLIDLVLLRRTGELVVYKNLNGQEFEATSLGFYNEFATLEFQHIDNDQNIDIVLLSQPTLYTFINDGNGVFSDSYSSNILFATPLFFNDIDEDGAVEYFYEDFGDVGYVDFNEEYVLDPTSNTFLFEGDSFQSYSLLDVDKDGDLDIITSEGSNDKVEWYEVVTADSVSTRGLLNSFLTLPVEPYIFGAPYLEDSDQFVIGKCGKLYINQPEVESIKICIHADKNDDDMLDNEDYLLGNYSFSISSDENYTVLNTDETGCVVLQLSSDRYVFNAVGEGCFSFEDEEVMIDQGTVAIDLLATQNENEGGVRIDLTSAPTRCGFTVEHWLTVKNGTCDAELGTIELELDEISLWNTVLSDQEFFQFEKFLTFDVTDIKPGESKTFEWTMEMPDFMNIGNFLDHEVRVLDINSSELANYSYKSEIRCAYDPNDKSIFPDRTEELGEAFVTDEVMTYLIRFQNVGNDTAFNIVIRDTLSANLDLSSLRDIRTSHTGNYTLDTLSRILQVNFDDIRLVDSLTNERESHGFVKFDIQSVQNLTDFEPIYNSAGIYFDFNPPIITNTVEAKYVHDLSILTSANKVDFANSISVHPNPATDYINVMGLPMSKIYFEMFSSTGQKVSAGTSIRKSDHSIDVSQLTSGLYFLKIFDNDHSQVNKIVIR